MRSSLKYALSKGKIDKAVEIGVKEGKNASQIVQVVNELYLVDPYMPYMVGGFWQGKADQYEPNLIQITQEEQNKYKKEMFERLAPYGDKIRLYTTTSELGSTLFPDNYFDYVYIDGNHSYEAVKKDLECWFSKVKKGGTLSGHDFNKPHLGVRRAVSELASKKKLKVIIIKQDDNWQKNWEISDWWVNIE